MIIKDLTQYCSLSEISLIKSMTYGLLPAGNDA